MGKQGSPGPGKASFKFPRVVPTAAVPRVINHIPVWEWENTDLEIICLPSLVPNSHPWVRIWPPSTPWNLTGGIRKSAWLHNTSAANPPSPCIPTGSFHFSWKAERAATLICSLRHFFLKHSPQNAGEPLKISNQITSNAAANIVPSYWNHKRRQKDF